MEDVVLGLSALLAAYIMFKVVTRPDPAERALVRKLRTVLNDPQYRIKGKYED